MVFALKVMPAGEGKPLRPFAVFRTASSKRVEVLSRSSTEALITGSELLAESPLRLRVVALYDW